MLFYFDFDNYFKMLRLAMGEQSWRVKIQYLVVLLVAVPIVSLFHAICFALDPLLFPSLRRGEIKEPVFIIGHGRSGTTLTFRLVDQDKGRFSSFQLWECYFPSLLQKKMIRAIAALDKPLFGGLLGRMVERFEEKRYGPLRHVHKMGLSLVEEDDISLFYSMASGFWMTKMPWMGELDFFYVDKWPKQKRHKLMHFYRQLVLRQLCLNGGGLQHLSKNPYWTGRVETLIELFPDARIVVNLRDPREAVPSLLKLNLMAWKHMGWDPDRVRASVDVLIQQSIYNYRHPLEVLEQHPEIRSAYLHYADLVANPAATIEGIYHALEIPMSDTFRATLNQEGPREKKHNTTFRYSLEEFGLEADLLEREFADLFERFGWAKADDASSEMKTDQQAKGENNE